MKRATNENSHPVLAPTFEPAVFRALSRGLWAYERRRWISGTALGRLWPDPARTNRGGLEYSDLDPLARSTRGEESVGGEHRGFQPAVVVCFRTSLENLIPAGCDTCACDGSQGRVLGANPIGPLSHFSPIHHHLPSAYAETVNNHL